VARRGRTLEEIEKDVWSEPKLGSHLVTTCFALRKKPVDEFTIEDLRIMIGQSIGLPTLLPLALDRLRTEPLAEGDFYPGDLLRSVLTCDILAKGEWSDTHDAVAAICEQAVAATRDGIEDELTNSFGGHLPEDFGLDAEAYARAVDEELQETFKDIPMREVAAFLERARR